MSKLLAGTNSALREHLAPAQINHVKPWQYSTFVFGFIGEPFDDTITVKSIQVLLSQGPKCCIANAYALVRRVCAFGRIGSSNCDE